MVEEEGEEEEEELDDEDDEGGRGIELSTGETRFEENG